MVSWPSTLPQHLLVQGFGQSLPEGRVRSANDVGPPKVRRRSSQNIYIITGQMVMTFDQWADLQTFVNSTTGGGTLPFLFRDPLSKIEPKLEIDFTAGTALIQGMPLLVRFGETLPAISEALGSDLVRVTMDLEVLPGPTGDFNGDVTDILQVTRASKATYFDADGVMQTADDNELRIDHDPVTGDPLGALIEGQSTNLFRYSEAFDNAAWTKTRATVIADAETAPDGETAMDKLVENTDIGGHYIRQSITATNDPHCGSVFAKAGERDHISVRLADSGGGNIIVQAVIDLSDGSVVSGTATVTDVGGGVYRISVTGTPTDGTCLFYVLLHDGSSLTYEGDGTSGLYVWGAQLETGSFATSYIKTEGSQVTRAAEAVWVDTSSFPFVREKGTLFVEYRTGKSRLGQVPVCIDQDNSVSNSILLFDDESNSPTHNRAVAQMRSGGNVVLSLNLTDVNGTARDAVHKMAVSWEDGYFAASLDGGDAITGAPANLPETLTRLLIGRHANTAWLDGHVRRIAYYPRCLSDTELQALTT